MALIKARKLQGSNSVDIYSASYDSITITLQGGTVMGVCTTDENGYGTFLKSNLPNGTYTFTSSVANNPDDLNNYYSKQVIVTSSTTEIYVMPDSALYWYGFNNNSVIQSSTGNTRQATFDAINHRILTDTVSGTYKYCSVSSIQGITAASVNFVWKGVAFYGNNYGGAYTSNGIISQISFYPDVSFTSDSLHKDTLSITSGQYIAVGCYQGSKSGRRAMYIYAIY